MNRNFKPSLQDLQKEFTYVEDIQDADAEDIADSHVEDHHPIFAGALMMNRNLKPSLQDLQRRFTYVENIEDADAEDIACVHDPSAAVVAADNAIITYLSPHFKPRDILFHCFPGNLKPDLFRT